MNESKRKPDVLNIAAGDVDRLLACADGLCALLYLHILRFGGLSLTRASRELRQSEADIALAAETLRKLGLISFEPEPEDRELPQYTAKDIVSRSRGDNAFELLVAESQQALGRVMNENDLRILFGIYDHIGLPAEVIVLLISFCVEECEYRHGEGRRPTMREVEKRAWEWLDREAVTLDSAEEYIRRCREKRESVERVKRLLQIRDRALTASELRYVTSWIDMGFSVECIGIAYDRTMVGANKLAWRYMDKILRSWCEKGLFTPEAIEAGDPRVAPRGRKGAPPAQSGNEAEAERAEIERMRRMYEHIRKERS